MLHFFGIWFFVRCNLLVWLRAEVDMPFLSIQVVPSKMKLDDLIRTSLMVMAVARAGEQQSVIRCIVHWKYSNIFRLYLNRIPLNRQRPCTSARHGGTWSSPPLSFQHSYNQEAGQGWLLNVLDGLIGLIPENVRWEKVLGLFAQKWLTYSTGSFLI